MISRIPQCFAAFRSGFLSRWALAPVVVARNLAIAIRLILKLELDEAVGSALSRLNFRVAGVARLQCRNEKPNSGEFGYHCQP